MLKICSIVVGDLLENCYMVFDDSTKKGFIIDPGSEQDIIFKMIEKHNIIPEFILITHGHMDHVNAADYVSEKYNIPVYITEEDMKAINEKRTIFGTINSKVNFIKDNDTVSFENYSIRVILTPGHTKGGASFYIDGVLFTGDTLFHASIGRTDMYGGNYNDIIVSIKNKLFTLPENTIVFPGHGGQTSISFEKSNNKFFK